jgi:anti-sigma regulatory factor (Ser/Thr protein kinase)
VEKRHSNGVAELGSGDVAVNGESLDFEVDASSPATARRFVRGLLVTWHMVDLTDVVELLVSEIVTNVVRHARTDGSISVSTTAHGIHVEVADTAGGHPAPLTPEPRQPTGRGLSIVEAMASRWGVDALADGSGKSVWFEVDRNDEQADPLVQVRSPRG